MKRILKNIEWLWDYYIVWMFYNGHKNDQYIDYMEKKWFKK